MNTMAIEYSAEYADALAVQEGRWWNTPERRSASAKIGWMRRRGLLAPDPWDLFRATLKAADPRLVRLYCCDVAEGVQGRFQARYPGDTRTLKVIAAGRRYANGELTEAERLAALLPIKGLLRSVEVPYLCKEPHACALQAAAFTTEKRLVWVAEWVLNWAEEAENQHRTKHLDFARYAQIFAQFARKET